MPGGRVPTVMSDTVALAVDDGVATITISRPDSLNALNVATLHALRDTLDTAESEGARAVVLTSAGDDAFIAGADISHMVEMDTAEAQAYAELGHSVADAIESFPAPVVAAIDGYAFGGGMELALACDLRVASEDAILGQTEIDIGIIPGWGGTQRLPRIVGDETARRMIYFGDRLSAADASEHGLVGEVVPAAEIDDHVASLARDLAAQPAAAMRAAKDAINTSHETTLSAGLEFEARTWAGLFGSDDQQEGMQAFLEDRDPDFE